MTNQHEYDYLTDPDASSIEDDMYAEHIYNIQKEVLVYAGETEQVSQEFYDYYFNEFTTSPALDFFMKHNNLQNPSWEKMMRGLEKEYYRVEKEAAEIVIAENEQFS